MFFKSYTFLYSYAADNFYTPPSRSSGPQFFFRCRFCLQCFGHLTPPDRKTFYSDVLFCCIFRLVTNIDLPPPDFWSVFSEPVLSLVRDERIRDAQRKAPWQGKLFIKLPCFKYRRASNIEKGILLQKKVNRFTEIFNPYHVTLYK